MNKLDPVLKKLMTIAGNAERSSETEPELVPPSDLILRVLRQSAPVQSLPQPSLLELMVQRGAAIAALVGGVALTVQFSANGPFGGIWDNAVTHGAVLLRVFTP